MKKQFLYRLIFALIGTLAVLFLSSTLYSRRSFLLQGKVTLDNAVNSAVCCAFGKDGEVWGRSEKFLSDIHGAIMVDREFFAESPRLFKIVSKGANIKNFTLHISGKDVSSWQRLRADDERSIIMRIPDNVRGTLQLNHLVLDLIALAAFILFYLISCRIIPEGGINGVLFADGIFVTLVVLALFIPASHISKDDISASEKRKLARFPEFIKAGTVNSMFGKELDTFFNDRFFLRDELLELNRILNTFTDSTFRQTGKVIKGRNGWYFYARNNAVRNYHNLDVFNDKELEQIADDVRYINSVCEKLRKKLYIFIVPDKHKIYGEYFPAAEKIYPDSASRAEQLTAFLRKNSSVAVHYFYDELHAAKKSGLTYWKNDTHWNSFGAYTAVRKMLDVIRRDHPEISEFELPVVRHRIKWAGDLSAILQETEYPFVDISVNFSVVDGVENRAFTNYSTLCNAGKYKLLFIRDSFALQQMPMLGSRFSFIRSLWSDYVVEPSELEHFKNADIIIFQCAERLLPQFLKGIHQTRSNLEDGGI